MLSLGRRCVMPSSLSLTRRSFHADLGLVDVSQQPDGWLESNATVYPNVVDEKHQRSLEESITQACKRKRYSRGHWDAVIQKYREFTFKDIDPALNTSVFDPIRALIHQNHLDGNHSVKWLPPHVIDLHEDGGISAHVDSTRFSGSVVCGVSLLSTCIMRLRPANEDGTSNDDHTKFVDLLLEPGSLYVLQGDGRYKYSHELRPNNATFLCQGHEPRVVSRARRFSIIFRDEQLPM